MPPRLTKAHLTLRAFIHSSSRSCDAVVAPFFFRPDVDEPNASTSFSVFPVPSPNRLYNLDDAPPPTYDEDNAPSSLYRPEPEHDPFKVSVRGGYIERRLPDKRGKLVKYVFPKPGFTLKTHPLASHPCVSGLGLDHGTLEPVKPIPAWEVVRRKRDTQRSMSQGEGHCNLPPHTLGAWIVYWDEHPPTRAPILPDYAAYEQPITYDSFTKRAPEFTRGPNSALLTCFLRPNHVADEMLNFDDLGVPSHIAEIFLALPNKAFDSGTHDLPTVTRISPAQYVLTCRSPIARRSLLAGWREFEKEVEASTGRMPPYTIEADEQQTEQEPAAAETSRVSSAYSFLRGAPSDRRGLDAQLDSSGRLWLGGARYARVEDLSTMLLQGHGATSSSSTDEAKEQPKTRSSSSTQKKPKGPRRSTRVEEPQRLWAMPPELAKLLA